MCSYTSGSLLLISFLLYLLAQIIIATTSQSNDWNKNINSNCKSNSDCTSITQQMDMNIKVTSIAYYLYHIS